MNRSKIILTLAAAASLAGISTGASAHDWHHHNNWDHRHPRQHEVLRREHRQLARINREHRQGDITGGQARAERATERRFARQDHADARANGGYITHQQQHQMNREENAQSRTIGQ